MQELLMYWPFVSTVIAVLLGGAVTWGIAKAKFEQFEHRLSILEEEWRKERTTQADRFARLEVKMDDVRMAILRLESR